MDKIEYDKWKRFYINLAWKYIQKHPELGSDDLIRNAYLMAEDMCHIEFIEKIKEDKGFCLQLKIENLDLALKTQYRLLQNAIKNKAKNEHIERLENITDDLSEEVNELYQKKEEIRDKALGEVKSLLYSRHKI